MLTTVLVLLYFFAKFDKANVRLFKLKKRIWTNDNYFGDSDLSAQKSCITMFIVCTTSCLLAATSSSTGCPVGQSVGRPTKIPLSLAATVCLCSSCPLGKRGAWRWEQLTSQRCWTSKWIHRLAQDLVEGLVMRQRTADKPFGPTGKKERGGREWPVTKIHIIS